jgi:hypothetical protein
MPDGIDHVLSDAERGYGVVGLKRPRLGGFRHGIHRPFDPSVPQRERLVTRELRLEAIVVEQATGHAFFLGESSSRIVRHLRNGG